MSEEKKLGFEDLRKIINGNTEHVFEIERGKLKTTITMKALDSDDLDIIDNEFKERKIPKDDIKKQNRESMLLRLSRAITSIKIAGEIEGEKISQDINVTDKKILEDFLRAQITDSAITALFIKYEEANNEIFELLKKTN